MSPKRVLRINREEGQPWPGKRPRRRRNAVPHGLRVVASRPNADGAQRGPPERITVDNGTAFTSRTLAAWASWNQLHWDFSRPGEPVDNCPIEAFNGSLRRERLSQHWFA